MSSALSSCVNVETSMVCIGKKVDYMIKKCTFKKCTIKMTTMHVRLKLERSFGAMHWWILMLCHLFKNKLIFFIFGMFAILVTSMTMLRKLNARMFESVMRHVVCGLILMTHVRKIHCVALMGSRHIVTFIQLMTSVTFSDGIFAWLVLLNIVYIK